MNGWCNRRLKHLVGINEHALPGDTDPELQFRYIDIASVGRGVLTSTPEQLRFRDAPSRARRLVRGGDTIVSSVRTYLRAVWPVSGNTDDLVVSTGFAVLTPGPLLAPRYLGWWAQSDPFVEEIVARSVGVSYPAINASEIGDLCMPLPPLPVQRVIADYLDAETAGIDALLARKHRMIALLEERVDSLVMSWVGRSSLVGGVDVGSVPLRRVLTKLDRSAAEEGEMVTAFRDGEVMARSARGRDGFTDAWKEGALFQLVTVGDVVVHGLDGFSGAIGDSQSDGVCSPVYHVCRPASGGDPAYYGRLLRLLALSGYLGNFATSTRERAVDFRNWDLFGRIPVPNVPIADQVRIGNLIRSVRPLRDKVRISEALAVERRQALITAAVTGKLAVPGAGT